MTSSSSSGIRVGRVATNCCKSGGGPKPQSLRYWSAGVTPRRRERSAISGLQSQRLGHAVLGASQLHAELIGAPAERGRQLIPSLPGRTPLGDLPLVRGQHLPPAQE